TWVRSTTLHGPTQRESLRDSMVHPPGMKCIRASAWVPVWALIRHTLTVLESPLSVGDRNSRDGGSCPGHMTDPGPTEAVMSMISTLHLPGKTACSGEPPHILRGMAALHIKYL